jgi:hypothetical protein
MKLVATIIIILLSLGFYGGEKYSDFRAEQRLRVQRFIDDATSDAYLRARTMAFENCMSHWRNKNSAFISCSIDPNTMEGQR